MCEEMYDHGYNAGYESGYDSGRYSQDWFIEDLQEEIAELERSLNHEQGRSQRLGIALMAAGVPSEIVEAIANGS